MTSRSRDGEDWDRIGQAQPRCNRVRNAVSNSELLRLLQCRLGSLEQESHINVR
jgi:hypothetical protein